MEAQLLTLSTNVILIAILWKLYDIHKFLSNERKSVRKHEQTQKFCGTMQDCNLKVDGEICNHPFECDHQI